MRFASAPIAIALLTLSTSARSATLTVDDFNCSLAAAIANANADGMTPDERGHGYRAGYESSYQQTASGLWGQIIGGADLNDPSVQGFLHWLVNRYNYTTTGAANAALPSLGDLRLIKGYTPEVIDKLSRYVTVFPNEGGSVVNINTADPIVIQALDHRITQTMATEIVQGRPYKKKEDLDRIGSFQQIGAELRASQGGYDVRSDFFSARLSVTVNEVTKTALVVLRRDPAKGESSLVSLRML